MAVSLKSQVKSLVEIQVEIAVAGHQPFMGTIVRCHDDCVEVKVGAQIGPAIRYIALQHILWIEIASAKR